MHIILRIAGTLTIAVFAAAACSSTSSNGSSDTFGGDLPTGASCMASCDTCAKQKCASQAACLHSDCQEFLSCFCMCAPGDMNCQFPCTAFQTPDNHCGDCVPGANTCLRQNCASECPDLNPDLSSTFDGGGGDDGSTVVLGDGGGVFPWSGPSCPAACGQCLQTNCPAEAACYRADCAEFFSCSCACATTDVNCVAACPFSSACQSCVAAADACGNQHCGTCSGAVGTGTGGDGGDGGDFCAQLTTCCAGISDPLNQASCLQVVTSGDATTCETTLLQYRSDGTCP